MLFLVRRVGETITTGDDVTVGVVGFSGGQVRLAIHAPRDITILREELYERGQRGNRLDHDQPVIENIATES